MTGSAHVARLRLGAFWRIGPLFRSNWRPRALARCVAMLAVAAGCMPPPVVIEGGRAPIPPNDTVTVTAAPPLAVPVWPIRVRQQVDLWLHGFAMLQADSTLVPYYRRGYRAELTSRRAATGLTTELDANGERLRARLAANPGLVSAQFLPLYFDTWADLQRGAEVFLRLDGDVRSARDRTSQENVATFGAYFTTAADRDWLRLFMAALEDERARFYDQYWREEQRTLGPVVDAVLAAWRSRHGPRFERFLANSRQRDGQILLSLTLAAEGRTLTRPGRETTVTVGLPRDTSSADAAVYVFAHEIVGAMVNDVVSDNTSPADRRSGVTDRYASLGAVRAGAMLLGRIAPELTTGYMRFYVGVAGQSPGTDPAAAFARTFPLPDTVRDALLRQIDIILGGI